MIVLGLGSNVGDRLAHLRAAIVHIKKMPGLLVEQFSPVYLSDALLPDNAPADWDMPHLNLALRCETTLTPLALLKELKAIEHRIGRKPEIRHWGPRLIDIDILVWDDVVQESEALTLPHRGLLDRPFALWPLSDVAPFWKNPMLGAEHGKTAAALVEKWGSRFTGEAPLHTRQLYQRIMAPQLVGIINVTPDSFSDGGHYLQAEKALEQAHALIQSGAEVLDIGAESTAPRAARLDVATEWSRLQPVLALIHAAKKEFIIPPKISIDTRFASTAQKALDLGVDWINDVTGLQDPAMRELLANTKADCVVMHHLSIPASAKQVLPHDVDGVELIYAWGMRQLELLEKEGIARHRIIFDPGIGFGKTPEQSLALIKEVRRFKEWGTRLLVGHSRKSFLSLFTAYPAPERDIETLTLALYLAQQAVDYVRVHRVEMCARGLRVAQAFS
jgi:2-amino-4-hydroxy-6-hydroxymethyldihydropteridine diphosphokinase / dihydropteroate synthase